jgi:hypothetical protein
MKIRVCIFLLLLAGLGPIQAQNKIPSAVALFNGAQFQGGAKDLYGSDHDGENVNYIYALPTKSHSVMETTFQVEGAPPEKLFLHLKGLGDDYNTHCAIVIKLNGQILFEGNNTFSSKAMETQRFAIPEGVLKEGKNTLIIASEEKAGTVGMPPWFEVAECTVAPEKYVIRRDLHKNFWVILPAEERPFPEPLAPGEKPGFQFRGTKGWFWLPEQYMAEIPVLAKFKLNFLMNCYGSMCDIEHYKWGNSRCNRWWEPLPEEKKKAYENVVRSCQSNDITFCFSMNPNLGSKRAVNDNSPDSVNALFKHYAWMQSLGVKWFNISLDDISQGIDAASQADVVNEIFHRLRARDSAAQMIFCPTYYWGDGTGAAQQPYLEVLNRKLDKNIYLFWTGDSVVGKITRKSAETFRRISGHRLFLWDNYPVNDGQPTLHLGPVIDRDPDLRAVVDGYMSNPMHLQNEANRIPLLTCLDYAWNPAAYDPARSIGQAIFHLADTAPQRETLRDLVDAYPGMLISGQPGTGFNAVQDQFSRIVSLPDSQFAAQAFIDKLQNLSGRLEKEFPGHYQSTRETLDGDIQILKRKFAARYPQLRQTMN